MSIIEMLRTISGVTLPEPYNLIEYLIAYGFSFVLGDLAYRLCPCDTE